MTAATGSAVFFALAQSHVPRGAGAILGQAMLLAQPVLVGYAVPAGAAMVTFVLGLRRWRPST